MSPTVSDTPAITACYFESLDISTAAQIFEQRAHPLVRVPQQKALGSLLECLDRPAQFFDVFFPKPGRVSTFPESIACSSCLIRTIIPSWLLEESFARFGPSPSMPSKSFTVAGIVFCISS